ncbi:MAG: hypothetical protein ABL982_12010 [Vicinamibacterales bacterium]
MSETARRPATEADFWAIPEAQRFHELIGGELIEKAAPSGEHGGAGKPERGNRGKPGNRNGVDEDDGGDLGLLRARPASTTGAGADARAFGADAVSHAATTRAGRPALDDEAMR